MGRLEIRVVEARNLANIQRVGTIDPYVKVTYGNKEDNKKAFIKYKTRIIESSQRPIWNELFKFQIADTDSAQVVFQVKNDNIVMDDILGTYALSLNGFTRGVVKDYWALLSGCERSSAELHLRVLAVDFGADPQPGEKTTTSLEQDQINLSLAANQTSRPPSNQYAGNPNPNPPGYQTAPPLYVAPPPQPVTYGPPPPQWGPPPPPCYRPPPVQCGYGRPQPPPPGPMYAAPRPPPPGPQMAYGVPPFLIAIGQGGEGTNRNIFLLVFSNPFSQLLCTEL
ncbi:c2 domain protein [Strigomonas culicis]|uniref:C2 domain protein n=1 Tax=Strigomonas culicis TaxID=28005 RepID=S9W8Q8_9TRYP|nr:c2 domain protein [Strigomonas culicis]|eukprot:EPY35591.1 c2 domain protein [Strigomonas culicis]